MKALEGSQHYSLFFQMLNGSDGIFLKFNLIKMFKFGIIVNCKNEEDSPKNEGTRVVTTFFPIKVNGDFSRRSRAANSPVQGPIWPNFEPIRGFVGVLVACKKKEEPSKHEGARVVTT